MPVEMAGKAIEARPWAWHEFDRAAIARRQRLIFAQATAVPDRTDGMNHMPRRQPISLRDFGIAGLATMERATFG